MADLSRRAILRTLPGAAVVTAVPALALATPACADAEIVDLAARIVALAKESDAAHCDLSDREDAASDDLPRPPSMLRDGLAYRPEYQSAEDLRAEIAKIESNDPQATVLPHNRWRLARLELWEAECTAVNQRHGIPAALARCDRVNDLLLDDLVPALTDMRPTTIAGVGAKGDAFASLHTWGVAHPVIADLCHSVIADVQRLAASAR